MRRAITAEKHYEGVWSDPDGDRWHNFSSQEDETLSFKAEAGDDIHVYLTWDDWPISYQDYDLYLYFEKADGTLERVTYKYHYSTRFRWHAL